MKKTATTAQVRRIKRSTRTTAGFNAIAIKTAIPSQIKTVRTLSRSDTAIENTSTDTKILAITRKGTSKTTRRGASPISTWRGEPSIVDETDTPRTRPRSLSSSIPMLRHG